jgi:hypothetical protein
MSQSIVTATAEQAVHTPTINHQPRAWGSTHTVATPPVDVARAARDAPPHAEDHRRGRASPPRTHPRADAVGRAPVSEEELTAAMLEVFRQCRNSGRYCPRLPQDWSTRHRGQPCTCSARRSSRSGTLRSRSTTRVEEPAKVEALMLDRPPLHLSEKTADARFNVQDSGAMRGLEVRDRSACSGVRCLPIGRLQDKGPVEPWGLARGRDLLRSAQLWFRSGSFFRRGGSKCRIRRN